MGIHSKAVLLARNVLENPNPETPLQRKRATDQRRGNKRSKLSEAQSGTVEGILLSSMLTGEPSTIRHPENNKSGDGGPTKNTPADDACDDDIGLGSESESCDDDVDNKMAVNRGAAGELANKERFEKLVRSLVVPREMESPFTHYSGLSGTTRSVQQQEFETTTKNEKGKPLSRSTMDLYTTYMNLFKRFCDDKYSEQGAFRYDVTPSKAGLFFEEVMFHRTTKKYFFKKQFKDVRIPVCLPAGFKDLVHMNRVDLADGTRLGQFFGVTGWKDSLTLF
ncbi:hypothetical protein BGW38_008912 [Lunasporangiospora selenospora]|uniref:Uncharacterized protein n=1 Tax=Lunasporangiospora selenospora TaxID=979761 RepID=A0A9P6K9B5_9FUNG|nr:hypothetical protein BGW38_008912 [Lunasporangiospora selenospora]